jgi:serine phosphatase RsbU (regulator of sigma subunit)
MAGVSPGVALGRLSAHQEHEDGTEYLTAFAGTFDLRNGTCTYANAGHPPALIGGKGRATAELAATGMRHALSSRS